MGPALKPSVRKLRVRRPPAYRFRGATQPGRRLGRRFRGPSCGRHFRRAVPATIAAFAALILVGGAIAPPPAQSDSATDAAGSAAPGSAATAPATAPVWVTQVKGIIDPALSGYVVETIERASSAGAAALVVQIDTPGGLDSSMRNIIQAEVDAPIPIVFYVYPQGARAASAGVYILMGADVAAMAPQTNLGAATPVAIGGEMDDVMKDKVTNDAAAYIVGLARSHGRNSVWAEQAVREAVSLPAEDALTHNVIDFVAPDLPALLQAIDGFVTKPKGLTLRTAGAPIEEVKMGWVQRFLHLIANPDIAYILMTIGILGIVVELYSPGLGVGGFAGVISLLLAFYAFQVLPVSIVGIALVVLAMILYVAELKIQSSGALGIAGTASLIAGGLLLFDTSAPFLRVSWVMLIVVAAIVVIIFAFVIGKVGRAMRRPHATGTESLAGVTGVTISPLSPLGQVRVHGEIWKAKVEGGDLLKDQPIEVLRTEGLTLIVRSKPLPVAETPTTAHGNT